MVSENFCMNKAVVTEYKWNQEKCLPRKSSKLDIIICIDNLIQIKTLNNNNEKLNIIRF